jgi:UDP-perosamine 4-acetyltransferase
MSGFGSLIGRRTLQHRRMSSSLVRPDVRPRCVIVGAGGHAAVVVEAIQAAGEAVPVGLLDADRDRWGKDVDGIPILGGDDLLPELQARGISHFALGLGGVRNNQPRQRLYTAAISAGLAPLLVCHPRAYVSPSARVSAGTQILCNAVINSHAIVGADVIVNTAAVVEHDCVVGDHVHLASGARLASGVRVGDGAHIGAGATVIQLITIGANAVVAAGACVVRDVPADTVVGGVPAHPLVARQ